MYNVKYKHKEVEDGIMTKKARVVLSIVLFSSLVLICIVGIGMNHIEQAMRQKGLSQMYSYEVYASYIATREVYYVYEMCNPIYTLSDIMTQKFTNEYFKSLKSKIDNAEMSNISTEIYLMLPSEELPYGWEKSELNISMNFDQSIFHRHTVCIITVPYGASTFDDCSIKYLS